MKFKKVLSTLLVATMALSMVACGNDNTQTSKEPESSQKAEASSEVKESESSVASEEVEEVVDWRTPYDETVTITVARKNRSDVTYTEEGDDLTNNLWTRTYKDELNIDLQTEWISDEYDTKLNLAISNGDVPDVFTVTLDQLNQLMDAGMLADLSEAFDTYASDSLKSFFEGEASIVETAKRDGALYAIPKFSTGYQPLLLWMRQDWLKEAGKELPTTVEELEDVLRAFKEISPDGYGFIATSSINELYNLAPAWGAYPTVWVEDSEGRYVYGSTVPEMKEALAAWASWYKEGILNQDFTTQNSAGVTEAFASGKAGATMGQSWFSHTHAANMIKNLGEEAYPIPCDIPTATGEKALYPFGINNGGYIVVSKDCENPEAAIKMINTYIYYKYDGFNAGEITQKQFQDYTLNNMEHAENVFQVMDSQADYKTSSLMVEAMEKKDTSALTTPTSKEIYDLSMKWYEDKNTEGVGAYLQYCMPGGSYDIIKNIVDEGRILDSKVFGSNPQEWDDYKGALRTILLEGFTKIIIGEEDIDYFDTLVEQFYEAGGTIATDAVNEMYNK